MLRYPATLFNYFNYHRLLCFAVDCDEEEMAAAARALKVYTCKSKEETGNWNASK